MKNITITGKMHPGFDEILTEEAQEFLLKLHQKFNNTRKAMLGRRTEIHNKILAGENPIFLPETESVRKGNWKVEVNAIWDNQHYQKTYRLMVE